MTPPLKQRISDINHTKLLSSSLLCYFLLSLARQAFSIMQRLQETTRFWCSADLKNQSRYFKLHIHISSLNWRMRKKFQIILQKNALTLWRYLFITTLKSYTIIPNITIISNQYNKKSLFRLFSGSALHHRFRLGTLWMFFLCATPTRCNTKPDLNDPRFFRVLF